MALLAKFAARTMTVLVESKPMEGWKAMDRTLAKLANLTSAVEAGWIRCPLARASKEDGIGAHIFMFAS